MAQTTAIAVTLCACCVLLWAVAAMRDEHDDIWGYLGIANNITQQKKFEEKLHPSAAGGGRRQQSEERIFGQHEPRNSNAYEWHHRHDRIGFEHTIDDGSKRISWRDSRIGRGAADRD